MDFETIENQYLADNKFYGQLIGVWPGQKKLAKYSIRLFIFIVVMAANIAQILQVVLFFSVDILTDQLLFLMLGFGLFLKQYNYVLNENILKELLNGIVYDRMIERPQEELKILDVHSKRAILFTIVYKTAAVSTVLIMVLLPTVPPILDIIRPLNVSRERVTIYPAYYFVDTQEYYYLILGHMLICSFILSMVFIACDINLVHVVQHGCALLAISGYRLKHAMDGVDFLDEKFTGGMSDKSFAKVTQAIISHKRADEYVKNIDICHIYYLAIVIIMITVAFTATFVKLTTLEMGTQYLTYVIFVIGELIHVLFLTIMGQFTSDRSDEVFQKTCEAQWYNGSVRTQALYVLVLRKNLNPQKLTGGGLFPLNLDIFIQILKASFSYYTVLKTA
ncbi:odorant receptor 43a-like [Ceratina calcarata]|uniref:Odorant receptor n=1 Tax=Ceratina calcarata TaxID=156304 RepID=A0AAJ7N916_9HYME|nr:odorant receptor 43a-like [Ceratina calcarata]